MRAAPWGDSFWDSRTGTDCSTALPLRVVWVTRAAEAWMALVRNHTPRRAPDALSPAPSHLLCSPTCPQDVGHRGCLDSGHEAGVPIFLE